MENEVSGVETQENNPKEAGGVHILIGSILCFGMMAVVLVSILQKQTTDNSDISEPDTSHVEEKGAPVLTSAQVQAERQALPAIMIGSTVSSVSAVDEAGFADTQDIQSADIQTENSLREFSESNTVGETVIETSGSGIEIGAATLVSDQNNNQGKVSRAIEGAVFSMDFNAGKVTVTTTSGPFVVKIDENTEFFINEKPFHFSDLAVTDMITVSGTGRQVSNIINADTITVVGVLEVTAMHN